MANTAAVMQARPPSPPEAGPEESLGASAAGGATGTSADGTARARKGEAAPAQRGYSMYPGAFLALEP